jgi:hypothetical protein
MSNVANMSNIDGLFGPKHVGRQVIVEGRAIPLLTGWEEGEEVFLCVDGRMAIPVRKQDATQIAWFVANAMAISAGFPCLGAETKDRPFAPMVRAMSP